MWLYRVTSMEKGEDIGVFYDATASLKDAIRMAKIIQSRSPSQNVTVEGENWPRLSLWKYRFHRMTGTDDGFGVSFKDKYELEIEEIRTVWP